MAMIEYKDRVPKREEERMKKNEAITKIMQKDLITVTVKDKLSHCRTLFIEKGIHHLPVVEGNKIIGILSYTDLLKVDSNTIYNQDPKQADTLIDHLSNIRESMSQTLITINSKKTIREATQILADGSFHSLPVVEEDNTLVGLVTSTDLLRYLSLQF